MASYQRIKDIVTPANDNLRNINTTILSMPLTSSEKNQVGILFICVD